MDKLDLIYDICKEIKDEQTKMCERIDSLESFKNKIIGACVIVTAFGVYIWEMFKNYISKQ